MDKFARTSSFAVVDQGDMVLCFDYSKGILDSEWDKHKPNRLGRRSNCLAALSVPVQLVAVW